MGGEDDVAEDDEARRRREEGCRREEAIRGLLKRHNDKRLTIGAVAEIAQELGVSRSTMYRLIPAKRAKGTVSSVEPRSKGRRKDTLVLDAKREKLIASTIHEIYLKPERPTMTYLIEQVRARCAQKGLPLPDRRTIKARVDRIDRRTVALKRKDAKGVKATKTVPGQYVMSRPLEVVQIDHTEVDVFLVDETTRKTMDKRPWLTLAIDVFTRMAVGFHLSMDKPSRVSLGLCMLNAVYNKSAWAEGARDRCVVAGRRIARDSAFGQRRRFPQPRFRVGMPGRGHQVDFSTHRHSPLRRPHRAPDRHDDGAGAFLSRIDLRQSWRSPGQRSRALRSHDVPRVRMRARLGDRWALQSANPQRAAPTAHCAVARARGFAGFAHAQGPHGLLGLVST